MLCQPTFASRSEVDEELANCKMSKAPKPQMKQNSTNGGTQREKSYLQLKKCNDLFSHAGRVVLCCVSPLLHLAVKWMKSWLIASGAYLACRLRQN